MDDDRTEILGVGEHVPDHLGVGEARLAVGEGDGAGVAQETDLGHPSLFGPSYRRHGMHLDARRVAARRMMKSTSATSSMTGSVLGMQMMVVTPPAAAARLVVDSVSRCSCPGSPENTSMSMRPGAST